MVKIIPRQNRGLLTPQVVYELMAHHLKFINENAELIRVFENQIFNIFISDAAYKYYPFTAIADAQKCEDDMCTSHTYLMPYLTHIIFEKLPAYLKNKIDQYVESTVLKLRDSLEVLKKLDFDQSDLIEFTKLTLITGIAIHIVCERLISDVNVNTVYNIAVTKFHEATGVCEDIYKSKQKESEAWAPKAFVKVVEDIVIKLDSKHRLLMGLVLTYVIRMTLPYMFSLGISLLNESLQYVDIGKSLVSTEYYPIVLPYLENLSQIVASFRDPYNVNTIYRFIATGGIFLAPYDISKAKMHQYVSLINVLLPSCPYTAGHIMCRIQAYGVAPRFTMSLRPLMLEIATTYYRVKSLALDEGMDREDRIKYCVAPFAILDLLFKVRDKRADLLTIARRCQEQLIRYLSIVRYLNFRSLLSREEIDRIMNELRRDEKIIEKVAYSKVMSTSLGLLWYYAGRDVVLFSRSFVCNNIPVPGYIEPVGMIHLVR